MLIVLRRFAAERNRERAKADARPLLNARKTAVPDHRSAAVLGLGPTPAVIRARFGRAKR